MRKQIFCNLLIISFLIGLPFTSFSQFPLLTPPDRDSFPYLTAQDTIFLSIDFYGEKVFEHTLKPNQTLFSVARFYGMKADELIFFNSHLDPGKLSIGQKIKIPIPNKAIVRKPNRLRNPKTDLPIYHKIKSGETLYRLSKMYYRLPIDTLKSWNNMTSNMVSKEKPLYVGWMSSEGVPDSLRKNYGGYWWKRSHDLGSKFRAKGASGKKLRKDKGAAFWQKSTIKSDELFALHRTAKPGSIIKISNPMSRRTVFVKVLGNIPAAKYQDNIKVVVSEQTAKLLGARDPRFFVEVHYWR